MSRFSYKDIAGIGRVENVSPDWTAQGVSTDSRTVSSGNIFFALTGAQFDGHQYVFDAFNKGAAAGVVSEDWYRRHKADTAAKTVVVVADTLKALQALAASHRRKSEASVIAVTGTNGKTTCKEMTCAVLSKAFKTIATQGNLNNEIGVPMTLLQMEDDTQMAVVEMGADKKGDIAFLCDMAKPDSGVITNIGTAHIQSFGSLETIAITKGELFEALSAHGVRFVNVDDERLRPYTAQTKGLVTFGFRNDAHYRGEIVSVNDEACVKMRVMPAGKKPFELQLQVPGMHLANNALIAAAIGHSLGMEESDIVSALEHYKQPSNRLGIAQHNGVRIINDTYNANPESMRAAIDTLMRMKRSGRAIAVLSDMLELGTLSAAEHAGVGAYIDQKRPDAVFTTGTESRAIHGNITFGHKAYFEKKKDLIAGLKQFVRPGDLVLVKGSRSMKMEEVVNALLS